MKELYEAPVAEMITFKYQEMVTTSSVGSCGSTWTNIGDSNCMDAEYVVNFA